MLRGAAQVPCEGYDLGGVSGWTLTRIEVLPNYRWSKTSIRAFFRVLWGR